MKRQSNTVRKSNSLFAFNPDYVAYENLLKHLHALIADGKGDEDEADRVRDQMEGLYWGLSEVEHNRLRGLSADLYMLSGTEVYDPTDWALRSAEALQPALNAARLRNDWEEVLKLMRRGPIFFARHQIAFMRAEAYQHLGHLDTALLFTQFASEQSARNIDYKASVLAKLIDLNRLSEAVEVARQIIQSPLVGSEDLLLSVHTILYATTGTPLKEAKPLYAEMLPTLERIVRQSEDLKQLPNEIQASAFLLLGFSYAVAQDINLSKQAYDRAIQLDAKVKNVIKHLHVPDENVENIWQTKLPRLNFATRLNTMDVNRAVAA